MTNDYFWSLKKEIEEECHSLALNLSAITDDDLSESLYRRFSHQIDHIQDLFDCISDVNKELTLEQSNPDFYDLLQGKQEVSEYYGEFNRQRSIFFKRFAKFRDTREDDFIPVRMRQEEIEEEPEELPEEIPEEEFDWEEECDPEAEKVEKAAERKARQKKLADEGKKRDARNAEQRLRQEEAARLGMDIRPGQSVSEADLYQTRIRQEEDRIRAVQENEARIQAENEALRRTRERILQSEQFEHLRSSHIDMSREGIGHRLSDSEQTASDSYATYGQNPEYGSQPRSTPYTESSRPSYSPASFPESTPSGNQIPSDPSHGFNHRSPDTQIPPQPDTHFSTAHIDPGVKPQGYAENYQEYQDEYTPNFNNLPHLEPGFSSHRTLENQLHTQSGYTPQREHASFIPYEFTPAGVAPVAAAVEPQWTKTADSNAKIYSALMANRTEEQKEPIQVSPAFETQMRFNVERARLACMDAKGTDTAPGAVHEYIQQRNILSQYQAAVKNGTIRISDPHTVSSSITESSKAPDLPVSSKNAGNGSTVFAFTPTGTVAQTVEKGQLTGNRYEFRNPGLKNGKPAYSSNNPMVVSAKYEEAITNKMRSATESLNSAINKGETKAHSVDPLQVKMYTDAYLGFQQAKREGSVVVSSKGEGPDVPDYQAWQQRRTAQTAKGSANTILGTTAQSTGANPNQTSKKTVEETSANIFNQSSHLKRQSMASMYAKQIGNRFQSYASGAVGHFSYQMYQLLQKGDDNALKTMETGRYYISTAAGLVLAVQSGAPTKGLANRVTNASSKEFTLYGMKSLMSQSELSGKINNGLRATRDLDSQIVELEKQISPLFEKKMTMTGLDKHSLFQYNKLSAQLEDLKKQRTVAQKDLTMHQKLRSLREESQLEADLLKKMEVDGKLPKNVKQLQVAAKRINEQMTNELSEKYGHLFFEEKGKKIPLIKATDASFAKELDAIKLRGKSLKTQIKALESKGSMLTQAEKQLLSKLKTDKAGVEKTIAEFKNLLKAKGKIDLTNKKLDELLKGAYKNKGRISKGLYALQGFMIRPLQVGYESNTEGLAGMVRISTNRYVHILVKKSFKVSLFMTKVGMNLVSPGSAQAAELAYHTAKAGIQANAAALKHAVKTTVKTAVHTGVNGVGKAISSAVPTGIKTRVNSTRTFIRTRKEKFGQKIFNLKQRFADSKIGRGFSAVKRFNRDAAEAIKAVFQLIKSFLLKGLAAFAGIFILVGFITIIISLLTSTVGTSVIASPDEKDGKVDLSKYVAIISEANAEFQKEINDLGTNAKYDNVSINYSGQTTNTKQMLCMMAVRMSQNLDLEKNKEVEEYLKSLYKDSHTYSTSERNYSCEGCKTREYQAIEVDPQTGLKILVDKQETYCPGHVDLTINISVLVFDEIFTADTYGNDGQSANAGEKIGDFKITHYCACEICCGKTDGITASGVKATANRTIAVDPSVIPLGTHVIINGKEYVAEDTGGAIKGNRIDIYMSSHQAALNAGVQTSVPVYYPSYEGGSYQETGEWDGWTEENIEWCKLIYNMPWSELYTGFNDFGSIIESGELIVNGDFTWPVSSTNITSRFGYRESPTAGASSNHKGVDIGVGVGTPVHATAAGTVVASTNQPEGAGLYVKIDHGGGVLSWYMHCSQLLVNAGDVVEQGQLIALSGNTGISTGPHLHFEIRINGTPVDPCIVVGIY